MVLALIFDFDGLILDTEGPNPDLYLAAPGSLEVSADETVALEDSPNEIAADGAAGVFCVAVSNRLTETLDLDGATLRLTSLAELPLPALLNGGRERAS